VQTAEKMSEAHFGKLFSVMKGKKSVLFDESLKLNDIIAPFLNLGFCSIIQKLDFCVFMASLNNYTIL